MTEGASDLLSPCAAPLEAALFLAWRSLLQSCSFTCLVMAGVVRRCCAAVLQELQYMWVRRATSGRRGERRGRAKAIGPQADAWSPSSQLTEPRGFRRSEARTSFQDTGARSSSRGKKCPKRRGEHTATVFGRASSARAVRGAHGRVYVRGDRFRGGASSARAARGGGV